MLIEVSDVKFRNGKNLHTLRYHSTVNPDVSHLLILDSVEDKALQ